VWSTENVLFCIRAPACVRFRVSWGKALSDMRDKDLYVISVVGQDRVGLVAAVTARLFREGLNIVDIEQSVIHAQFTMVVLVEPFRPDLNLEGLRNGLEAIAGRCEISITLLPLRDFKGLRLAESKRRYVLTILGQDKPGIVATVSETLSESEANIERIKMIARRDFFAMEMMVDIRKATFVRLRERLTAIAERISMDIVFQPEAAYEKRKKLIVFDMDSTIVDAEVIDELAKQAGVETMIRQLTARSMNGMMDFEASLRERVLLLRGLSVEALDMVAKNLRLTKGASELISVLKEMGFKIAVISGGFTYFTDILRKRLGLDYAFGNELEIQNGLVTGRLRGPIIDAARKAAIVEKICEQEGITTDEVVAVGDGSNDRIMVATAGLGIGFNAKAILKKVADGTVSKDHMKGILYCMGIRDAHIADGRSKESERMAHGPEGLGG